MKFFKRVERFAKKHVIPSEVHDAIPKEIRRLDVSVGGSMSVEATLDKQGASLEVSVPTTPNTRPGL